MILLPMYKSFVDPLVIYYSLIQQGIKIPFAVGCGEDTPNITFCNTILNNLGLITYKRNAD